MKRIDALRIIDKEFDSKPLVITCGATAVSYTHLRAHET